MRERSPAPNFASDARGLSPSRTFTLSQLGEHWHDRHSEDGLRLFPRLHGAEAPAWDAPSAPPVDRAGESMQSSSAGGGGGGPKRESEPAVVVARVISVGPAGPESKSAAAALAELDIQPPPPAPLPWTDDSASDSDWDTPAMPEAAGSDWSATPFVPEVAARAAAAAEAHAHEAPLEAAPEPAHDPGAHPYEPPPAPIEEVGPMTQGDRVDAFFDATGSYHPHAEPDPWPSNPPPAPDGFGGGVDGSFDGPDAADATIPHAPGIPAVFGARIAGPGALPSLESLDAQALAGAVPPPVDSSRSPQADSVPPPPATFTEPAPPGEIAIEDDLAALEASMEAADRGVWKEESFDELFDELDTGFDALLDPTAKRKSNAPTTASHVFDDAKRLFSELAASHMRHVKDFVIDLTWGPATSDWLGLCAPAAQSLRAGAQQFELLDLVKALDGLVVALEDAARTGLPSVEGKPREIILEAYKVLAATLPEAFTLDTERKDREGIIVKALLEQIEDVRKVQQDKLFAAGLMALDVLFSAKPKDVADTTGLSMELATRIAERFRAYKEDVSHIEVDPTRKGEWLRLASNLRDVETYHRAYEQANDAGHAREKKSARKQREMALLDVKIMLARLGEVQALYSIERAAFSGKIEYLRRLLREKEESLRITLLS